MMPSTTPPATDTEVEAEYVRKTYRYLRTGMAFMLLSLAAAVFLEWRATGYECLQTSISAYYYTPAQAVLVSALVAVGACMMIMKAPSEWEDIALNIGGLLAPVVAFVPTPGAGSCHSVIVVGRDQNPFVKNNMTAYVVTGIVAVIVTIILVVKERQARSLTQTTAARLGLGITILLVIVTLASLAVNPDWFIAYAHYIAAVSLFVCIIVIVVINAWVYQREPGRRGRSFTPHGLNLYAVVAAAMALVLVVMLPAKYLTEWSHAVFWIELSLIGLFAAFWLLQTYELWHRPVRPHDGNGGAS